MRWLVAKFMSDLRRREPRNIGVILFADGVQGAAAPIMRFRGLSQDGRVDLRRAAVGHQGPVYEGWLAYWMSLAEEFAPLEAWLDRSPMDAFYLEQGGELLGDLPPGSTAVDLVDELYEVMVEHSAVRSVEAREETDFGEAVNDLLRRSGLLRDPHFKTDYAVELQGLRQQNFHYAWANGQVTVGQRLSTWKSDTVDATALRLALLPPGYSSVVLVPSAPKASEKAIPLERVSHLAVVDDVRPADLWEMFTVASATAGAEDPTSRLAALSQKG